MRLPAYALVLLLVLAPVAAAGPMPVIYFLKDAPSGPAVDGVLDWQPPPPADLQNPANNEPPGVRLVTPILPTQFVTPDAANNTGRILGPVIMGLWAPDTQTVQEGTLVVELVQLAPGDGTPIRVLDGKVLATAEVPIIAGNLTPPDPTTFLPNGTDPEEAIDHIAAQAVAYALPLLLQAPKIVYLQTEEGPLLDVEVPADALIALRFTLVASGTLPLALAQAIEYDFGLSPTFVYMPWFDPTPAPTSSPTPSPTKAPTPSASPSPSGSTTHTPGDSDTKDSPSAALVVVAAGLLAGVAVLRRRMG